MLKLKAFTYIFTLMSCLLSGQTWTKKYMSVNSIITSEAVLPFSNGYFVNAHAFDTVNLTSTGSILCRLDANGEPLWAKKFSFSSGDYRMSVGLLKTIDGNLLHLMMYGSQQAIMKTDTVGNFIWGKQFTMPYTSVYKIVETTKGNIVLVGVTDHGCPTYNGFILWLNQHGEMEHYDDVVSPFQWNAQLHLVNAIPTSDGGCLVIGWINKNYPANNTFMIKLDSTGTSQWTRLIGDNAKQRGISVVELNDGYLYAGDDGNSLLIGKTDKNGNKVWNKTYKKLLAMWPNIKIVNSTIEIVALGKTDSIYSTPIKYGVYHFDLDGNFISGRLSGDSFKNGYLKFATAAYSNLSKVILKQEHGNGFKLIKANLSFDFKDCYIPVSPAAVVATIFSQTSLNCSRSSTIPIDSFIATTEPYIIHTERACTCEPAYLTHKISGCNNQTITINPSGGDSHLWNNGQVDSILHVLEPAIYWVQNTNSCTLADTFKINFLNPEAEFNIPEQTYSIGDRVQLINSSANATHYKWDFNDVTTDSNLNTYHSWTSPGEFHIQLIASNGICSDTATSTINVNGIIVPNVFTPNNDGVNDLFVLSGNLTGEIRCTIYDRWGKKIIELIDFKQGWDGNGCNDGTYFYNIQTSNTIRDKSYIKGTVTLIR